MQSSGQFCTKPGVIIGIEGGGFDRFKNILAEKVSQVLPAKMLHDGITKSFHDKRKALLQIEDIQLLTADNSVSSIEDKSFPTLAMVSAQAFIENQTLHHEVFGPYSLVVSCSNKNQMMQVARSMEGQLTCSVMATEEDLEQHKELVEKLSDICGRLILNGVPTGVAVVLAMHHGGPYPATTDSRFTAVGADGIKRFARPLCLQNWTHDLLPDELKNNNSLGLWRTVNNVLTKESIRTE
jgi:NADP-dependent aldehyde dehydrogenase